MQYLNAMIPGVGGKFGRIIQRRERNLKKKKKKGEKKWEKNTGIWRYVEGERERKSRSDDARNSSG